MDGLNLPTPLVVYVIGTAVLLFIAFITSVFYLFISDEIMFQKERLTVGLIMFLSGGLLSLPFLV